MKAKKTFLRSETGRNPAYPGLIWSLMQILHPANALESGLVLHSNLGVLDFADFFIKIIIFFLYYFCPESETVAARVRREYKRAQGRGWGP